MKITHINLVIVQKEEAKIDINALMDQISRLSQTVISGKDVTMMFASDISFLEFNILLQKEKEKEKERAVKKLN